MKEEIMVKDRDNGFKKLIQEFVQNSATLRLTHTSIKLSLKVHHFPSLQVETSYSALIYKAVPQVSQLLYSTFLLYKYLMLRDDISIST